jgi:DNA-binding NarL/FixJ family response regulator
MNFNGTNRGTPEPFVVSMLVQTTASPVKILLVDDQELVRRGIRALLEQQADFQVIADLPLQADVLGVARTDRPDVIIFEPNTFAGRDIGLRMTSDLASVSEGPKILILTDLRDPHVYTRFLLLGALGVVLKHQPSCVLVKAIRKLNEGEAWLDRANTVQVLQAAAQRHRQDGEVNGKVRTLTKREREIITHICAGLRNEQVAERLCISTATARNHVTSILQKLELANRFDLVVFAHRHRMVDRDDGPASSDPARGDPET